MCMRAGTQYLTGVQKGGLSYETAELRHACNASTLDFQLRKKAKEKLKVCLNSYLQLCYQRGIEPSLFELLFRETCHIQGNVVVTRRFERRRIKP